MKNKNEKKRKKDHREKKCLEQNKCAIIFITRVFWKKKQQQDLVKIVRP
jgi:hypothetical protein